MQLMAIGDLFSSPEDLDNSEVQKSHGFPTFKISIKIRGINIIF